MDPEITSRVRRRYDGDGGTRWERIETGRASNYFEQNAVLGRRKVLIKLLEWLETPGERSILDGGCGLGTVAQELADRGARVTGIDLVSRFIETARKRAGADGAEFETGSFLDLLGNDPGKPRFDSLLVMEVLEDYTLPEQRNILETIAASGIDRIHLVFRKPASGLVWRLLPDPNAAEIDPVELLRWIHLNLPYRQARQTTVTVRSYQAHLSELVLTREG